MHDRRKYNRFDESFAESFVKEFFPDTEDETQRNQKIKEWAKKTKSKYNTLKRHFFNSKKGSQPDFPLLVYVEGYEILNNGKSHYPKESGEALDQWSSQF